MIRLEVQRGSTDAQPTSESRMTWQHAKRAVSAPPPSAIAGNIQSKRNHVAMSGRCVASVRKIRLSTSCNCANTAVAATNSATILPQPAMDWPRILARARYELVQFATVGYGRKPRG